MKYLSFQKGLVVASVLLAVLVAILFALSITAMLPLMKVMIGDEGLHGWAYRGIVQSRSGLILAPASPESDEARQAGRFTPLFITNLKGPAETSGQLKISDAIVNVVVPGQNLTEPAGGLDLLERIVYAASTDRGKSPARIELQVQRPGQPPQTVALDLESPPFYTPLVRQLLHSIPKTQSFSTKISYLKIILVVVIITTALRCLLRFLQACLVRTISFTTIQRLRNDVFARAVRLPMGFYTREGVGDTISRFVQDSFQVKSGIETILGKTTVEPFKIISLGYFAYLVSPKMTFLVIVIGPMLALTINRIGRKMKKATKRTLEEWSNMLRHLQGTLMGIRVVKGYHQEQREELAFQAVNDNLLKRQLRMGRVEAASAPLMESIAIIGACGGMIFATRWLTEDMADISKFFTLIVILGTMAESGRKLGDVWPKISTANASAERVFQLYDRQIEQDAPNAFVLPRLAGSIEFQQVGFTYPGSLSKNLDGISFKMRAGQTVAVVGPNGSGKTTLLSLLPRFYDPDEGRVLFDGRDIKQGTLESLRTQIGIVPQQPIVFHDTIAANIAYSKPGATEAEILNASRQAFADEFIKNTPQGYQTLIGEQGATLSGGQLQRIAIARAILRNPAILIFDEAMSQIDSESEHKIQQAIREFSKGRTSFIIAHRLSTIIDSDLIVVLDNGRLVSQGTHKELMQSCDLYKQLYTMQFGGLTS